MSSTTFSKKKYSRRAYFTIFAVVLVCIVGITVAIVLWQTLEPKQSAPKDYGEYGKAAVSCDAPYCSDIAVSMLERGGSVADAAIAGLLCMGVVHSQSSGIGGGFLMVLYNKTRGETKVLNARERAPAFATEDMFDGDANKSQRGGLAVGIPGEIKGFWELHQIAGKLPWKDLFTPTIELCTNGFQVSMHTANAFAGAAAIIKNTTSLAQIFIDQNTGEVFKEGDLITRPVFAETLKRIAENGGDEFYTGQTAQWFVEDLQELDGNITMEDMANYKAEWSEPLKFSLSGNMTLHSVPPPGSGLIMGFIMQILDDYLPIAGGFEDPVVYQRITEAFKHAYAKRTILGDPYDSEIEPIIQELIANLTSPAFIEEVRSKIMDNQTSNSYEYYGAEYYAPEDHGTAHISVIGANGDAIAVTSTVNLHFGAKIRSVRTGIIYNDEMDDFSAPNITNYFGVPPSVNNFIKPGKRPLSSMTPAIFTDAQGNVRLSLGTAGGTKITTSTPYVAMRNLWFNQNLKVAIDARRIHHQLYPMAIEYEEGFGQDVLKTLKSYGHNATQFSLGGSVTCGVAVTGEGTLVANSDFRKGGTVAGY